MATDNLTATLQSWYSDLKDNIKDKLSPRNSGHAGANGAPAYSNNAAAGAPPKAPASVGGAAPANKPPSGGAPVMLGPYEVTDGVLGEGGYAKVVLGRHRETGEKVAIKLLDTRGDQASGRAASSEAAVVREVAALRRAGKHPNVCELKNYYRLSDTCHAMVMEICRGGELFRLVEKYGAIDENKVRPLFKGMLEGVRHLHAQGIAHRDLKLENILLSERTANGIPKIVDLGLAHVHARGSDGAGWADRALTQFCGSRSYCAPEVMARLGYNGYAADVWSLGVCLFGLVAGFFPVDEASNRDWRFERLARHQHVHPERSTCELIFSFYERPCPLSPALRELLDRMLQVAPSSRASLADVLAAPWVAGHSVLPPATAQMNKQPEGGQQQAQQAPAAPALPTQQLMELDMNGAAAAPPAASESPSTHQVEIDISDFLQRSAGDGDGVDAMEYRSLASTGAPVASASGLAPPSICRQRAEDSVGMF